MSGRLTRITMGLSWIQVTTPTSETKRPGPPVSLNRAKQRRLMAPVPMCRGPSLFSDFFFRIRKRDRERTGAAHRSNVGPSGLEWKEEGVPGDHNSLARLPSLIEATERELYVLGLVMVEFGIPKRSPLDSCPEH